MTSNIISYSTVLVLFNASYMEPPMEPPNRFVYRSELDNCSNNLDLPQIWRKVVACLGFLTIILPTTWFGNGRSYRWSQHNKRQWFSVREQK